MLTTEELERLYAYLADVINYRSKYHRYRDALERMGERVWLTNKIYYSVYSENLIVKATKNRHWLLDKIFGKKYVEHYISPKEEGPWWSDLRDILPMLEAEMKAKWLIKRIEEAKQLTALQNQYNSD